MKKRFYQFLKDNNCLIEYLCNRYHQRNKINLQKIKDPKMLIATAFIWSNTEEGYIFWSRIDDKWNEIYFKFIKAGQ